jgi:predicted component of type VI protein secretion system
MLVLVVQSGKYKGKRLKLGDAEVLIGRDEDAAVRISSNEVSRQHCLLTPTAGGVIVRDLGSRNGTFVDGAPIGQAQEVALKPGGSLTVGPMTFELIDTSAEVKPRPEPGTEKDASLSDDDIATWLTEGDTSDQLSTGDTTIIVGRDSVPEDSELIDPTPKQEPKRQFGSVAEEAADIIRRHQEMLEGGDAGSDA